MEKATQRHAAPPNDSCEDHGGGARPPTFTDVHRRSSVGGKKPPPPALRQRRIIRRLLAACLLLIGSVKQHERGEGGPTSSRAIDPITEFEEPIVADGIPTERLQPRSCSFFKYNFSLSFLFHFFLFPRKKVSSFEIGLQIHFFFLFLSQVVLRAGRNFKAKPSRSLS